MLLVPQEYSRLQLTETRVAIVSLYWGTCPFFLLFHFLSCVIASYLTFHIIIVYSHQTLEFLPHRVLCTSKVDLKRTRALARKYDSHHSSIPEWGQSSACTSPGEVRSRFRCPYGNHSTPVQLSLSSKFPAIDFYLTAFPISRPVYTMVVFLSTEKRNNVLCKR